MLPETREWWKEAVVYQIYPKSFQDTDGDGVGDLPGIIQRLPYLEKLGVDVIWICPIYKSPMDDGGYDIADYYQIDERFGTNEDFDCLLREAEKRGIKVLMDLVVNHTSDEHEWFQQALADPKSKYRDYYIFREGQEGQPPNNWRTYFGDNAWTQVAGEENMFYLHAFTKKQPDLNWENPEVREEIYRMINYWLDKGLGGFRIDAILNIKKRLVFGELPADGEDGLAFIGHWILNQPGIEVWLQEMQERCFKPHDAMTVAEANVPAERLSEYIGPEGYYSMVFDFSYTDIDVPVTGEWFKPSGWTWQQLRENIFDSQLVTQSAGWGALYLENHDQPRSISKYLPAAENNDTAKKMLATLFMLLRGTPFIYQGQELGMSNIEMTSIDEYDDVATYDQYQRGILAGLSEGESLAAMNRRSRDNSRTPMQWNDSENAGFSDAEKTWLRVNPNYVSLNAESESPDPYSVLNYYRKLTALRKDKDYKEAVVYGLFAPLSDTTDEIIAYQRLLPDGKGLTIAINNSDRLIAFKLPAAFEKRVLGNYEDFPEKKASGNYLLRPYEALVTTNY